MIIEKGGDGVTSEIQVGSVEVGDGVTSDEESFITATEEGSVFADDSDCVGAVTDNELELDLVECVDAIEDDSVADDCVDGAETIVCDFGRAIFNLSSRCNRAAKRNRSVLF